MRHAFDLDDSLHQLWLARAGTGYRVELDGCAAAAGLDPLGGHRYALTLAGERTVVHLFSDGDDVHLHLDGVTRVVRFIEPVKRFAAEASQSQDDVARAPMPGVVIATSVSTGQQVAAGDPLLVIESMKLETTIRASRDGEVETVHVAQGQTFDRGALLVTLKSVGA